ncbi:Mov34/MPN/PAD-1 family protein [Floridanema aerugineum]|uniref:Mov34/MPN/PAD-1 family protein n=1 Tax=Floridaenema aerugineum BLCC-F46 TaxID=3153654 RepID=A0ABV4X106_9CYAN
MGKGPDLPDFSGGNDFGKRVSPDSESQNKIVWVESQDVYKPILKSISDFTNERGISDQYTEVYIREDALEDLKTHLKSNLRVEQGGILFGNAYSDPHYGIYVEITAAVAAPKTIGTGASLEFTSDSWLSIMNYARSQHPQENIVGWYHSHPNLGVFMSGTDMNTQRAFFHHPWCLSIVCDPVRKQIGYFLGERAIAVCPSIFGQIGQSIEKFDWNASTNDFSLHSNENNIQSAKDNEQPNRVNEGRSRRQNRRSTVPFWLIIALIIILGLMGSILLNNLLNYRISKPVSPFDADMENIPLSVFKHLETRQFFLGYRLVKIGEKIGGGDEVTLLVIPKKIIENANDFQLVTDILTPKQPDQNNEKVEDVEVSQLRDLMKNPENLSGYNYTVTPNRESIDLRNVEGGVIVPMFSSHQASSVTSSTQGSTARRNRQQVSPSESSNNEEKLKRVVRSIVYIPRSIEYKDSNNETRTIEIKIRQD